MPASRLAISCLLEPCCCSWATWRCRSAIWLCRASMSVLETQPPARRPAATIESERERWILFIVLRSSGSAGVAASGDDEVCAAVHRPAALGRGRALRALLAVADRTQPGDVDAERGHVVARGA